MASTSWAPAATALCLGGAIAYLAYAHGQRLVKEEDAKAAEADAKLEAASKQLRESAARREAAQGSAAARAAAAGTAAERAAASAAAVAGGDAAPGGSGTSTPMEEGERRASDGGQPPREQPEAQHDSQQSAAALPAGSPLADLCAQCGAAPTSERKLLLCTRCRAAKYCSDSCQRAAWPKHKACCTAAMKLRQAEAKAAANGGAANGGAANGGAANGGEQQRDQQQQDQQQRDEETDGVLAALGGLLQRSADARGDALQRTFETSVAQFVRGDYRGAAAALADVSARARAEGRLELAGDALRWLGHAHNRLGAPARAVATFAEGAAIAGQVGSKRLQVDCLSGLGVTHRAQLQLGPAVAFLRQALVIAESMDGPAAAPARASVMTNLGSALMGADPEEAAALLRDAVALREQQVVDMHNSGETNGLATAIMEHASALVNLAGALYVSRRYGEARDAYAQSLEVFEMVGDGDKVARALVNLANLHELQLEEPGAFDKAAEYRGRLYALAKKMLDRDPPESCSICLEPMDPLKPSADKDAGGAAAAGGGEASGGHAEGGSGATNGGAAAEVADAEASAAAAAAAAAADGPASAGDDAGADSGAVGAVGAGPEAAAAGGRNAHKANRVIVLACLHCYHHGCWEAWSSRNEDASCPSCKQPVPLF